MKKAALYVRVSTKDKGQDVENQLRQLKEFCKKKDFEIVHIYQDTVSGSKGRNERAGFDQLFKDAYNHKFDIVVFWALDRFSREGIYMTMTYLRQLNDAGIKFISYTEEFLNTENELVANILITVLSYFAELERNKISERTKAALQKLKAQGYKLGKRALDPAVVQQIKDLSDSGLTIKEIMKRLGVSKSTVMKYKKEDE